MKADPAASDYRARIDRLIDYVESTPEERPSLERLAEIAGFPAVHLRRIFLAITGEPLGTVVARARGAADVRAEGAGPRGDEAPRRDSARAAEPQPALHDPADLSRIAADRAWQVELVDLPQTDVVSVRVDDAGNRVEELLGVYVELLEWLTANGVDEERIGLIGISHDDPQLREPERGGFEWIASPVPDAPRPPWIETRREPSLTAARILVLGSLHDEDLAWQYLYRVWLPESGVQPAPAPAREIYRRLPHLDGWRTYDLWCALPVAGRPDPPEEPDG